MNLNGKVLHLESFNVLIGGALSVTWMLFAYRYFQVFQVTHSAVILVFCISETLQAGFFLFRSIPQSISLDPYDWMVAIGGSFVVLFFRPGGAVLWSGASVLVFTGAILQLAGILSLNRSFAIVASRRVIKTRGMYRFVRHPMYASYALIYFGYLLLSFDVGNLFWCILAFVLFVLRINSEERHLQVDSEYCSYKERVKYRLIPFVY